MSPSLALHIIACVAVPVVWGWGVHVLFHRWFHRAAAHGGSVNDADELAPDEMPS